MDWTYEPTYMVILAKPISANRAGGVSMLAYAGAGNCDIQEN